MSDKFKITKPIRLIELFSGYGSQHLALKYIGANFESWKTCEWAYKSIQAYKDLHFENDNNDYSKGLSHYEVVKYLVDKGISANYNEPMKEKQIIRLGETKARQIYNNIIATHNLVNIQQVKGKDLEITDTDKFCYMMTYSFPCQDLSVAGLGKGMAKDSGTRSGMLWEVERILDEINNERGHLPQVLLMENVPQVHGTKNREHFDTWVEKLKSLGYSNYWQDLNAKDFGVPQNRKRTFMVSILGESIYEFPQPRVLDKKLKDLLEDEVDEQFYLSDSKLDKISQWKAHQDPLKDIDKERETCPCLTARGAGEEHSGMVLINEDVYNLKRQLCNKLIENDMVKEGDVIRHSYSNNRLKNGEKNMGRIESQEHLSPTLDTRCDCLGVVVNENPNPKCLGGVGEKKSNGGTQHYQQDRIYDDEIAISVTTQANPYYSISSGSNLQKEVCNKAIETGVVEPTDVIDYTYSNSRLNEIENGNIKTKNSNDNNIFCTLTTNSENFGVCVNEDEKNYRIRKLTPKECFRLMGVKDEDFDKIAKNQSNQSLYHLAGDSIVVDVLMAIFKEMIC